MIEIIEAEDIEIIQNILGGNEESECLLYNKYKKIIHDYLIKKYPEDHYIDDHVSDILIKVFGSIHKYDHKKSKFKTWVITIVNNHMIDCYRSKFYVNDLSTINVDLTSDSVYGSLSDTSFATNTDFNSFDNNNTITYISNQLNTDDFTILNMHYILGYSYNEIGSEFNITSSTVSNRVNYIKTKLKNTIDKDNLI